MQTMDSELCVSISALINSEVEEKGNDGNLGFRKRNIDSEEEEEDDDVDEEGSSSGSEKPNKEHFIREIEDGLNDYIPQGSDIDFENEEDMNAYRQFRKEFLFSDGFDMKRFCRPLCNYFLGPLRPLDIEDGLYYGGENCRKAVKNVLKFHYEKNGSNLQFVKLTKANTSGHAV